MPKDPVQELLDALNDEMMQQAMKDMGLDGIEPFDIADNDL